jgi:hypothetical protein
MGHIRSHGCQDLLVYYFFSHSIRMNVLPDDTVLLALERRLVCTSCGLIGAGVRPDWSPHTGVGGMGRVGLAPHVPRSC